MKEEPISIVELAQIHVRQTEQLLKEQERLLAELRAEGRSTVAAERVLAELQDRLEDQRGRVARLKEG